MKRLIMIYALTAFTFCHAMLDKDLNDETLPFRFGALNVGTITQEDLRAIQQLQISNDISNDIEQCSSYVKNRRLLAIALERLDAKKVKNKIFLKNVFDSAIAHQDYPTIHKALQHDADPNWRDGRIVLPLFFSKSVAIASLLIAYKASFTSVDFLGETILHAAMHHEIPDDVLDYYLKNSGVDVNTPNNEGSRPAHELALTIKCFLRPCYAKEKIALLTKAGARWNLKDNNGRTALQKMKQTIPEIQSYITPYRQYRDKAYEYSENKEAYLFSLIATIEQLK